MVPQAAAPTCSALTWSLKSASSIWAQASKNAAKLSTALACRARMEKCAAVTHQMGSCSNRNQLALVLQSMQGSWRLAILMRGLQQLCPGRAGRQHSHIRCRAHVSGTEGCAPKCNCSTVSLEPAHFAFHNILLQHVFAAVHMLQLTTLM